jgi:hypothetical protein
MVTQEFKETGIVERFPGKGGWFFIKLPDFYTNLTKGMAVGRSFVKIKAQIGSTSWNTSLLPLKGGIIFIAIKAEVRKKEEIQLGDMVEISFSLK